MQKSLPEDAEEDLVPEVDNRAFDVVPDGLYSPVGIVKVALGLWGLDDSAEVVAEEAQNYDGDQRKDDVLNHEFSIAEAGMRLFTA